MTPSHPSELTPRVGNWPLLLVRGPLRLLSFKATGSRCEAAGANNRQTPAAAQPSDPRDRDCLDPNSRDDEHQLDGGRRSLRLAQRMLHCCAITHGRRLLSRDAMIGS